MNKRLRRKLRRDEFQEMGFTLEVEIGDDLDEPECCRWLDDFIEMIEAAGLCVGGGCREGKHSYFVASGSEVPRRHQGHTVTPAQQEVVRSWLTQDKRVTQFRIADLVDAWYDDPDE